jgi:hypothetical protein
MSIRRQDDLNRSDVATRAGPKRAGDEEQMVVIDLRDRERPVADDVLGLSPVVFELHELVSRPRKGPRPGQDVREVAARLPESNLQALVLVGHGGDHVLDDERGGGLLLAHGLPGRNEVVGRHRLAVAPPGVRTESKPVLEPVVGNAETLGKIGHHVERAVQLDEPAEEEIDKLDIVLDVCVPGSEVSDRRTHRLDSLTRLELARRVGRTCEGILVGPLRLLEVEGQVMGERDLEERLSCASVISETVEELERASVVLERLVVGVERPGGVARLEQVVGRAPRLVRLAEVVPE